MGTLWLPNAERIPTSHSGGSMAGGPPRVIWHRTAGGSYESNKSFLVQESFEPHLLWDPYTGQIGQFMPLNVSAYAVKHTGSPETNRMGSTCIQIEVADNGQNFVITDTPMKGLSFILDAIRSWGIPDVWPLGPPSKIPGPRAGGDPKVWINQAGHYGHCHVPENDHDDPGYMDPKKLFATQTGDLNMDEATFKQWVADVVDSRVKVILHGVPGDPTHQNGLDQIKQELDVIKAKLGA